MTGQGSKHSEVTSDEHRADALTPPRPGVRHVLLWMLGIAVILGAQRAVDSLSDAPTVEYPGFLTIRLLYAFAAGAGVGGLFLAVARIIQPSRPFPILPGHWLLCLGGFEAVVALAGRAYRDRGLPPNDWLLIYLRTQAIEYLVDALVIIAILLLAPGARARWWLPAWLSLLSCYLLLSGAAAYALVSIPRGLGAEAADVIRLVLWSPWPMRIILVGIGVGAICDWRYSVRRDWLHWIGVTVWATYFLVDELSRWLSGFLE